MSDTEHLLPCPFCGHDTPEFERMGTPRQSCIVLCGNCGCRHESSDENERNGQSWNTRALESQVAQIAALTAERDAITDLNHSQWLALENVRLLAARHRKEEWAKHMLRFCEEARNKSVAIHRAAVDAARTQAHREPKDAQG